MPERWERELKKLEGLDAPATTRARIDEGPHGEGVPPAPGRGQRIMAGVVAFAVFGAAAALAFGAFGNDATTVPAQFPPDAVVVTFEVREEGMPNPTATMRAGGREVEGFGTSYGWDIPGGSMEADFFWPQPDFEFEEEDFLTVVAGAPLFLEGSANDVTAKLHTASAPLVEPIGPLPTHDGRGAIPTDLGRVVISFTASWPEGARDFYFAVEIVPSEASPSPSLDSPRELFATLDAPDDGTMPSLTLVYGDREQDFFAQGGEWPGVDAFPMPLFSFQDPLATGAVLRIEGDADAVDGELGIVRDDGSLTDDTLPLDLSAGSATLPTEPGYYELDLTGTWPRGTAAFFVRIQIGQQKVSEPSPLPAAESGVVPDLVGIGEGDAYKLLYQAGLEGESAYEPVPGVAAGLVVSVQPAPGTAVAAGSVVQLVVSGVSVPLDGYLTPLDCSTEDMMPFGHDGVVLEPAGEDYIRVNVEGVLESDNVVRPDQPNPFDDVNIGLWHVIRSREVIAIVDYETLEGVACRSSGIGGV